MKATHALVAALGISILGCGAPDARLDGGPAADADVAATDAARSDAASDGAAPGDASVSDDGGGIAPCAPSTPGAPTYAEHQVSALAAICAAEERCGGALAPWFSFGTACHPGFASDSATVGALVDDGSVCFEAAAAAECIAALETGDCAEMARVVLGPCRGALRPMLAAGEACVVQQQCFAGSCRFDAECPGTCVARPAAGACATVLDCAPGLACNGGTCGAPRPAGEPCDSWLGCEPGLACIGGECAPRLGEGERCMQFDCETDLYCYDAGAVSVCRARETAGGACDADEECALGLVCSIRACRDASGPGDACAGDESCPRAFHCDASAGCVPLPRFGEACDARGCWEGDCVAGVCTGRGAGDVCSEDRVCEGYCDIDVVFGSECVDPRPLGASCSSTRACERGLVCRAGACRVECAPPT